MSNSSVVPAVVVVSFAADMAKSAVWNKSLLAETANTELAFLVPELATGRELMEGVAIRRVAISMVAIATMRRKFSLFPKLPHGMIGSVIDFLEAQVAIGHKSAEAIVTKAAKLLGEKSHKAMAQKAKDAAWLGDLDGTASALAALAPKGVKLTLALLDERISKAEAKMDGKKGGKAKPKKATPTAKIARIAVKAKLRKITDAKMWAALLVTLNPLMAAETAKLIPALVTKAKK